MSGLFMDEDVVSDESTTDTEVAEPDEVVEAIPLVLDCEALQPLHLLQYTGRSNAAHFPLQHAAASVKPESGFVAVKVPLDTGRFYDESRAEDWGVSVADHDHVGVFNKTNGGVYAARFRSDAAGRKIVLFPVESTAQLRPAFKYLDDSDNQKMLQKKQEFADAPAKQSKVHILQSTAKSKASPGDPLANSALGETLRHVRKFDQEEWQALEWHDGPAAGASDDTVLTTTQTMDQYIEQLTNI